MRMPKKGEKGFTLIELLIVVAILGVLAAVVIPNIQRFIGAGTEEARETDYATIRTSVHAMMVDNGITSITADFAYADNVATNDMSDFPDNTITLANKGADGPFVTAAIAAEDITAERTGWLLYGNQIVVDVDGDGTYDAGDGDAILEVDYVASSSSEYYYTCESDGTIRQFNMADLTSADKVEYTY